MDLRSTDMVAEAVNPIIRHFDWTARRTLGDYALTILNGGGADRTVLRGRRLWRFTCQVTAITLGLAETPHAQGLLRLVADLDGRGHREWDAARALATERMVQATHLLPKPAMN